MEYAVTAILDANILYPAPMRDLFVRLAQAGLFHARWTEMIHDEWTRNVLKDKPDLSAERVARTRNLMNGAIRDCLVSGFEDLIDSLTLPDANDRHVLAAAIRSRAEVIVTCNLKDFPIVTLAMFNIRAQHPDEFLIGLLDAAPDNVCAVVRRQREALKSPPKSAEELLSTFEMVGLPRSAMQLRQFVDLF